VNYKCKCNACGATCWVGGSMQDPETGDIELNENKEWEWTGGNESCPHEEYEIIDHEYEHDDPRWEA